jgi:hypothetical protein
MLNQILLHGRGSRTRRNVMNSFSQHHVPAPCFSVIFPANQCRLCEKMLWREARRLCGHGTGWGKVFFRNEGAGRTGAASGEMLSAAHLLSDQGERLPAEVHKFIATMRAA